jgi:hypothetical protein
MNKLKYFIIYYLETLLWEESAKQTISQKQKHGAYGESLAMRTKIVRKFFFLAVEDDHLAVSVGVGPLLFVCIQFGKVGTCLQLLHLIEFASSYRISCC